MDERTVICLVILGLIILIAWGIMRNRPSRFAAYNVGPAGNNKACMYLAIHLSESGAPDTTVAAENEICDQYTGACGQGSVANRVQELIEQYGNNWAALANAFERDYIIKSATGKCSELDRCRTINDCPFTGGPSSACVQLDCDSGLCQ